MWLGSWFVRKLARRRPDRGAPAPDADRVAQAQREAARAEAVLRRTIHNTPAVVARENRAARLRQADSIGPAVVRYLTGT